MHAYRPDRIVRALTMLVSVLYHVLAVGTVFILVIVLVVRLGFPGDRALVWAVPVPVFAEGVDASVDTRWGPMELSLARSEADLMVPFGLLPWWAVWVLWAHTAIVFVPAVIACHQLRRIFQRARDGAPFDARNAVRLRTLGLVLVAMAVLEALAQFVTRLAIRPSLATAPFEMATLPNVDFSLIFVGLAVVALAEVFRRGAELENEQSLVI